MKLILSHAKPWKDWPQAYWRVSHGAGGLDGRGHVYRASFLGTLDFDAVGKQVSFDYVHPSRRNHMGRI
jgi:hypothetical protein